LESSLIVILLSRPFNSGILVLFYHSIVQASSIKMSGTMTEEIDTDICQQIVHVVIWHDADGKRLSAHECAVDKTELSVYPAARRALASYFVTHKQLSQLTTYHWPVLKAQDYVQLMHKESRTTPGTDLSAFFVNGYALIVSPPNNPPEDKAESADTATEDNPQAINTHSPRSQSHTDVVDLLQLEEKVTSSGWVFSSSVREQTVKIVASFSISAMPLSEAILLMPSTGRFAQELYQSLLREKNRRLSIPAPPPMKLGSIEADAILTKFHALKKTLSQQNQTRQTARVTNSFASYVSRDDPQLKLRLEQRRKQLEESFHVLPLNISEAETAQEAIFDCNHSLRYKHKEDDGQTADDW
jgi:hypothetical protein